jgi:hypothetical protein
MRKIYMAIFMGGIIILMNGCKSTNNGIDVIDIIQNDLQVRLWEKLGENDSRALELQFSSLDEYGCKNVFIPYELNQTWYNIDINLQGIAIPEDCIPGNSPAYANIPLNNLSFTNYRFGIKLREVIDNQGMLTVTSDKYHLNIQDTKGVIFLNKTLMRIPPATLWGYLAYENDNNGTAASEFIAKLQTMTSPIVSAEGDYGYFIIDQIGRVTFSNTGNHQVQQTFIFQHDMSTMEQIKEMLTEYRSEYPEITFKIFTSEGAEL